ncbi:secretion protein HlyD [Kamptonema animale CS-326]|jgi:hypothetical protein|uniref:hypothetical protein n=1 Tax=Kamptonema TaxID=1501433 RepID=UPI0003653827|nr:MULTISPECIES: hypothetical protein [Kamptonema]MDB9513729.1 secretion protein HlyD [Kamptonema animale CS-326]
MQEAQNDSLFTELTAEESATINGAYGNCRYSNSERPAYNRNQNPRQHYMYYPRRERAYRTMVVVRYR